MPTITQNPSRIHQTSPSSCETSGPDFVTKRMKRYTISKGSLVSPIWGVEKVRNSSDSSS